MKEEKFYKNLEDKFSTQLKGRFKDLADEFLSEQELVEARLNRLKILNSEKELESVQEYHAEHLEFLKNALSNMRKCIDEGDEYWDKTEKLQHKVYLLDRLKDLRRINSEYRKQIKQITKSNDTMFKRVNKGFKNVGESFQELLQARLLDKFSDAISGLKQDSEDTIKSDYENNMAMMRQGYKHYYDIVNKTTEALGDLRTRISHEDVANSVREMALGTKLSEELIQKASRQVVIYDKQFNVGEQFYTDLITSVKNNKALENDFGGVIKVLGDMQQSLDEAHLNISSDAIARLAKDNAYFLSRAKNTGDYARRMSELASGKATATQILGKENSDKLDNLIQEIITNPMEAQTKLSYLGLDAMGLRKTLEKGGEAYTPILKAIKEQSKYWENPFVQQEFANNFGLDTADLQAIERADLAGTIEKSSKAVIKAQDKMVKNLEEVNPGYFQSTKNVLSNFKWVRELSQALGEYNISITDVYVLTKVPSLIKSVGTSMFELGKSMLRFFKIIKLERNGLDSGMRADGSISGSLARNTKMISKMGKVLGGLGAAATAAYGASQLYEGFKNKDSNDAEKQEASGREMAKGFIKVAAPIVGAVLGGGVPGALVGSMVAEGLSFGIDALGSVNTKATPNVPQHRSGVWRVDRDGELATLHKDEAVLPKTMADMFRKKFGTFPSLSSFFKDFSPSDRYNAYSTSTSGTWASNIVKSIDSFIPNYVGQFLGNRQDAPSLEGKYADFTNKFLKGAVEGMTKYKILPSVTLAQGALESAWGETASGKNNYFGIKGKGTLVRTQEDYGNGLVDVVDEFADYATLEDGIKAHSKLLTMYDGVAGAKNYVDAFNAIKAGGYATDPDYVSKLIDTTRANGFDYFDNPEVVQELAEKFGLPTFRKGSPYITKDQLAVVHKGEQIIPKGMDSAESGLLESSAEIVQVLKWGFEFLGKKIEQSNKTETSTQERQMPVFSSKSDEIFRLGATPAF